MVFVCMGFIFYMGSVPGSNVPPLFPYQDIVYHFMIYLILAVLFSRALKNTYPKLKKRELVIITAIFAVLYGASDELHQLFTPGRSAAFSDVLIDGLGGFIGSLLLR